MLKQASLAFLFCLTGSIANAQNNTFFESTKPVVCDESKKVIASLMERYNEVPLWTARDGQNGSRYLLLVNEKKGTWTLLQYTPETACVLGVGTESNLASDYKN